MNIKDNSKKVKEGDTFVSLTGNEEYIKDAINRGAKKIVTKTKTYEVETINVENPHEYLVNYLKNNYYDKIKDIKLIGITGTNGKTTTCFLIYKMLQQLGLKSAYIGTIGFYMNEKISDLNNTTPDILDLYDMLLECKKNNIEYVAMETSSHAIDQNRLGNLKFDYCLFTNLTMDHLDYHKSMENYALAKQKLFRKLKSDGFAIVNSDSPYKDYFLLDNNNITYGFNKSDYQIKDYKIDKSGSKFSVLNNGKIIDYNTELIGKHNIYNILSAIIVLEKIGIQKEKIKKLVSEASEPVGRMDKVKYNDNVIIIDYAHTPDAVSNVISSVRELEPNKIYTLIGCGGDRDRGKRYKMALISTSLSDYVIFTSDNPRNEDPNQIINDMVHKLDTSNYEIVVNREKAIIRAIQLLEKNDILLLLGKGHETYQIIGHEKIHFDDKEVVTNYIRRRR